VLCEAATPVLIPSTEQGIKYAAVRWWDEHSAFPSSLKLDLRDYIAVEGHRSSLQSFEYFEKRMFKFQLTP
jgi:hypothetical protein